MEEVLKKRNIQDDYVGEIETTPEEYFNVKKRLLKDKYICRYMEIPAEVKTSYYTSKDIEEFVPDSLRKEISSMSPATTRVRILTDQKDVHYINELDLVFTVTFERENKHITAFLIDVDDILKEITTEIGGQRMDKIHVEEDIETSIHINNLLFKGSSMLSTRDKDNDTTVVKTIVVPLTMAPFYSQNLLRIKDVVQDIIISTRYQNPMMIYNDQMDARNKWVRVNAKCSIDVKLYGNVYTVDERLLIRTPSYNMATYQYQYTGKETVVNGSNTFRLNFNHPTHLLYFWGLDKKYVSNVKLVIDGVEYFNGHPDILESNKYKMFSRQPGLPPPSFYNVYMLFFSDLNFFTLDNQRKTINFSCVDKCELIIDTSTPINETIYIIGVSSQSLLYMSNMFGMKYSK